MTRAFSGVEAIDLFGVPRSIGARSQPHKPPCLDRNEASKQRAGRKFAASTAFRMLRAGGPIMARAGLPTEGRLIMQADIDTLDPDAPIFAPQAFRLSDREADLIAKSRRFGRHTLAPRAANHDRDATFPIENFRDMHHEGL